MRENGFLEDQPGLGTVRDILAAQGQRADRHRDARRRRCATSSTTMKQLSDQPAPGRRAAASCAGSWPRSTCSAHLVTGRQDARLADRRAGRGRLRDGDARHEDRAAPGRARRREGRHRHRPRGGRRHRDEDRPHRFLARLPGKGASTPPPAIAAGPRRNGDTKGPATKAHKAKKSAKAPKRAKEKPRARA